MDALLEEEMVSDDDFKVSQKMKSSKVSRKQRLSVRRSVILSCHKQTLVLK